MKFDEIVDRKGSNSVKYDMLKELYGRDDLCSMWVADMDFRCDESITKALMDYYSQGIYGYAIEPPELKSAIQGWLKDIQCWDVEKEWISFIPGIVKGISYVVEYFTRKGDKVLVQTPVYHPFMLVSEGLGRELVFNPLTDQMNIDFDNFERVTDENDCKLFIFCNPHNPGGVVWSREDMVRLAEICHRKGIVVISDEIHADLILWGDQHIPFASVSDKAQEVSITFGAPSKTFNIPGLSSSFCVIPSDKLRKEFYHYLVVSESNNPKIDASIGMITAFTKAREWRKAVMAYVEENIKITEKYFEVNFPLVKVRHPRASYLLWLDCRELLAELARRKGVEATQQLLIDYFVNEAHMALNSGEMFGRNGEGIGFMRMNIALPREVLMKALNLLKL